MNPIAITLVALAMMVAAGVRFMNAVTTGSSPSHQKAQAMSDARQEEGLRINETIRQIWDSGLNFYEGWSPIFWLDDSTLLFKADKYPKAASPKEAQKRIPWLYLWRLGEKPHPVGDDPYQASRFYRAARGNLCFQQMRTDPRTGKAMEFLMVGPPGEEQEAPPRKRLSATKDGAPFNLAGYIEDIDCKEFADPAMAGRIYHTDPYRHYYLDRAASFPGLPPAAGENLVLMKADGANRKVLPIPPEEVGTIYFRTFENVFWTVESPIGAGPRVRGGPSIDGFQNWKATNCLALWRIDPASGSTERLCIPFGPWSGRTIDASRGVAAMISLVPTTKGLFFTSSDYLDGTEEHVGPSGLYELGDGSARRVLGGYIKDATVSPSGCRIAFVYGPNWASRNYGTPGTWTIAAIDLCTPNSQPQAN